MDDNKGKIVGEMSYLFRDHIRKNKGTCHTWDSPVDVQPFPDGDRDFFQPDSD